MDVDEDGLRPAGLDACNGTEDQFLVPQDSAYNAKGVLRLGTPGKTTVFCEGIKIRPPSGSGAGEVVFAGNIVISGGELDIAAQVAISSPNSGVGFYLMDAARLNMVGGAGGPPGGIGLVAQEYGPLKNFVFFEDPNSTLEGNAKQARR